MTRAWLLCALGACWHSDAPPAIPVPTPVAKLKPPPPHERELDLPAGNDRSALSTFLRKSRLPITTLVDGPVVWGDLATGSVDTLCGAQAEDAVRRTTMIFRDPDLPFSSCQAAKPSGDTVCIQGSSTTPRELVILYLRYSDRWRLDAMMSGPLDHTAVVQAGSAMRAALAVASCP